MVKQVRYCMELIREVLRLKWEEKKSNRVVGQILKISKSTVATYLIRAKLGKITSCKELNSLDDLALKKIFFPDKFARQEEFQIDFKKVHKELGRPHVTLMLLWQEEAERNPKIFNYSNFCRLYGDWRKKQKISMRQIHKAGEKSFIDYAGSTVSVVVNPKTGETREAQIFIIAMGVSHYAYIEATWTQGARDFLRSHINALEFFGGSSKVWVPDNLKTGVNMASKYEPEINRSYRELAKHYGIVIIPARVRKPKDKSIVENSVKIAYQWILARIRDYKFFSLDELNEKLWILLDQYNNKKFQGLEDTRRSLFEEMDKPALRPLPKERFELAEWKKAKANIDYHVELEKCYYSVPYKYRGMNLLIRHTDDSVEVFHESKRIAVHKKLFRARSTSTIKDHMPSSHRFYADWTPSRILNWAGETGRYCQEMCKKILETREHPEQAFRSCMGIIRLEKKYSKERVENACRRSLRIGGHSYKSIDSILKKGLDYQEIPANKDSPPIQHENIRGSDYYKQ